MLPVLLLFASPAPLHPMPHNLKPAPPRAAEDESPQAVLPDLLLLSIARARPATPAALLKLLSEHPVATAATAFRATRYIAQRQVRLMI